MNAEVLLFGCKDVKKGSEKHSGMPKRFPILYESSGKSSSRNSVESAGGVRRPEGTSKRRFLSVNGEMTILIIIQPGDTRDKTYVPAFTTCARAFMHQSS